MRTPIPVLITAFFWALGFSPVIGVGHALNLGCVVLLATAAGSTPLSPRKARCLLVGRVAGRTASKHLMQKNVTMIKAKL